MESFGHKGLCRCEEGQVLPGEHEEQTEEQVVDAECQWAHPLPTKGAAPWAGGGQERQVDKAGPPLEAPAALVEEAGSRSS